VFLGDAFDEVGSFPDGALKEVVVQLYKVRQGLEPNDWEPMSAVDSGVRESRIRANCGAFHVLYVTPLTDAVVVLHAFEKKTQKAPKRDLDLTNDRRRTFTAMQAKEEKR
jgi:phage-related protein